MTSFSHDQLQYIQAVCAAEVGVVGGFPAGGDLFGAAYNSEALIPTSTMIDLIQGGNLDAAVLGCAEASFTKDNWVIGIFPDFGT